MKTENVKLNVSKESRGRYLARETATGREWKVWKGLNGSWFAVCEELESTEWGSRAIVDASTKKGVLFAIRLQVVKMAAETEWRFNGKSERFLAMQDESHDNVQCSRCEDTFGCTYDGTPPSFAELTGTCGWRFNDGEWVCRECLNEVKTEGGKEMGDFLVEKLAGNEIEDIFAIHRGGDDPEFIKRPRGCYSIEEIVEEVRMEEVRKAAKFAPEKDFKAFLAMFTAGE